MAKKIKIVGSALVIEDTITSEVILDRPSKDMYYNSESLDTGTVILLEKEGPSNTYINKLTLPLINVVDSLDVAFTAETFRTFARENLGFKIAGSTALTTSRYRARVLEDGGTLEGLSTLRYEIDKATNKGRSVPSLLMIPSGKKENILHSVLPTNGSGDFTVVRDSPVYDYVNGNLETTPNNVPFFKKADGCSVLTTQRQSTNIYLNNPVMVTQNVTTTASTYTVSFWGTGSINFTGSYVGSLVGTGDFERVELTFVAASGTLTSNVTGAVVYGQCEEFDYATSIIVTGGTPVTRLADVVTVAPPVGVTEIIETINGVEKTPITIIPAIYQVPVYDLGEELVVNGGFDSTDNWTGWIIENGYATRVDAESNYLTQIPNITLLLGKTYAIQYTVTEAFANLVLANVNNNVNLTNTVGEHFKIIEITKEFYFSLYSNGYTGKIDNISVKEILPNEVKVNKIIMK